MAIRQYRSFDGPSGNAGQQFNKKLISVNWAGWDNTAIRRRGGDWTDGAGTFRGLTPYTNPDASLAQRSFSAADLDIERSINVTAIVKKWEGDFVNDKGFFLRCTTNYGVRFWPRSDRLAAYPYTDGPLWPKRPRLIVTTDTGTFDCPVTATCMVSCSSYAWKCANVVPGSNAGFGPCGSDTTGSRAHVQFDLSAVTGTVSEALMYLTVRPRQDGTYLGSGASVVTVFELEPNYIRVGSDGGGAYEPGFAKDYPRDVGLAADPRVTKVFDVYQFPYPVYSAGGTLLGYGAPPAGGFDGKSLGPFAIDTVQPDGRIFRINQVKTPDPNGPPMIYSGFAYEPPDYVAYPGTGYKSTHCPWGGSSIATMPACTPPTGVDNCQPGTVIPALYARYCVRFSSEATNRPNTPQGLGWADKANSGIDAIKSLAAPCGLYGDWTGNWTEIKGTGWRWSSQTGGGTPSNGRVVLREGKHMFMGWSLRPRTTMRYFDGNPYDNLVGVDCYANFANMVPNGYGDADDPPHAWNFHMEYDKTYSIEVGVIMNTVNTAVLDSFGNGIGNPDGSYSVWCNGRKMYEHTGMIFSHHPGFGVQGLYEDWIHGGNGPEVAIQWDMIRYMGAYAFAEQYIGPYVTSDAPPPPPPPPPDPEVEPKLRLSAATRNAMLEAVATQIGASPLLEIYDGSVPALTSDSVGAAVKVASMTLPATPFLAPANGVMDKTGTWEELSADAAGTGKFFRILTSGGTCHIQGTVTQTGGGGELQVDNPVFRLGQGVRVSSFRLRVPGE